MIADVAELKFRTRKVQSKGRHRRRIESPIRCEDCKWIDGFVQVRNASMGIFWFCVVFLVLAGLMDESVKPILFTSKCVIPIIVGSSGLLMYSIT